MKHVLGFSGGIDSQACARWLLNRYPAEDVILLNSDAGGNEHPMTTEFIETYSRDVHPVVMVSPIVADLGTLGTKPGATKDRRDEFNPDDELTFDRLAYIKGIFPSRQKQFCTTFLKLVPQNKWMRENIVGEYQRYSGLRREEGTNRRNKRPIEWDDYFGCPLHHPVVDWTKQMCFDYVEYHGEECNPLYRLGFDRVGCFPCVNSKKPTIRNWAIRSPECIDKIRAWEKQVGKTFFMPLVPGKNINWIDDVVDWAKTRHGGKQYDLLVLQDPPACESDYGLCE